MNFQTWRTIRVREAAAPAASASRAPLPADDADADADADVVCNGTEVAPVSFFGEIGIATPGRFRL